MISPRWFSQWLGAIRQQVVTWANVDPDMCHYMVSLSHNELIVYNSKWPPLTMKLDKFCWLVRIFVVILAIYWLCKRILLIVVFYIENKTKTDYCFINLKACFWATAKWWMWIERDSWEKYNNKCLYIVVFKLWLVFLVIIWFNNGGDWFSQMNSEFCWDSAE